MSVGRNPAPFEQTHPHHDEIRHSMSHSHSHASRKPAFQSHYLTHNPHLTLVSVNNLQFLDEKTAKYTTVPPPSPLERDQSLVLRVAAWTGLDTAAREALHAEVALGFSQSTGIEQVEWLLLQGVGDARRDPLNGLLKMEEAARQARELGDENPLSPCHPPVRANRPAVWRSQPGL